MRPFFVSVAALALCVLGKPLSAEADRGLGSVEGIPAARGLESPANNTHETVLDIVTSTIALVNNELKSINNTLAEFRSGGVSKDVARGQASSSLQALAKTFTGGVERLSATPSPGVNPDDLNELLKSLDHIINEIIVTVIDIIKLLGSPALASVLKSVLEMLYAFLSTIVHLVDLAIPAAVKLLVPLLKTLRNAMISIIIGLLL
ncbi:hypothetical protein JDV02_005593 [Purpureocillium takamizusanense]|uniref:Uncharacterized protein n=1 Tax=Purpureocillium takamizusanense TaxID=2060973 RepID=A0A9Q8QIF4_9HYPO|nr:uncharacterized protein JDV02_005593 [Purpureocillium takamizusanense]UNI19409.1 hypothetical protein JDV02_005593 [Purpureocillium takamizusanense]